MRLPRAKVRTLANARDRYVYGIGLEKRVTELASRLRIQFSMREYGRYGMLRAAMLVLVALAVGACSESEIQKRHIDCSTFSSFVFEEFAATASDPNGPFGGRYAGIMERRVNAGQCSAIVMYLAKHVATTQAELQLLTSGEYLAASTQAELAKLNAICEEEIRFADGILSKSTNRTFPGNNASILRLVAISLTGQDRSFCVFTLGRGRIETLP